MKSPKVLSHALAGLFAVSALSACVGSGDPCAVPADDGGITQACAASFLEDEGFAERTRLEGIRVYRWPEPVGPSDVISEGISEGDGRSIRPGSESWFFFVDLFPGALWNHPAQYVLVDRGSGEVTVHTRMSAPSLNGMRVFASPESLSQPAARIEGFSYETVAQVSRALTYDAPVSPDVDVPPASGPEYDAFPALQDEFEEDRARRYQGSKEGVQDEAATDAELSKCAVPANDPGCAYPKRLALVIMGGDLTTDGKDMVQALRSSGYTTLSLTEGNWDQPDPAAMDRPTTLAEVGRAFDWLASEVRGCCDDVVVFIYAHGSTKGLLELNPRKSVEDWEHYNRTGEFVDKTVGHPGGGYISTATLAGYLNRIKSCQTKVVLYSCYSGRHFENGLNVLTDAVSAGCMCRTVMTTSSARQATYPMGYRELVAEVASSGDIVKAFKAYKSVTTSAKPRAVSPQVQSTDCVLCEDGDEDGIRAGEEIRIGTDPGHRDSDRDGLGDGFELYEYGSDPTLKDTDADGLTDLEEIEFGSKPDDPDSDDDGFGDKTEFFGGSDPMDPESTP